MANIKSSKKDLKRSAKARARNIEVKSSLKTFVKKVRVASTSADETAVASSLSAVTKALDKAVQRGVIHKNQAARRKSRIAKAANAALKAPAAEPKPAKPVKAAKAAAPKAAAKKATK